MRAVVYDRVGPARDVLSVVELPDPHPGAGEVRVRIARSGVNPSDVKTRSGMRSQVLPFPRLIPHSDGAGVIDEIGTGVAADRVGERVWIWNGCWGRANGTAADYIVVPAAQAVALPANTSFDAGACLGIPALTALHAVMMDGGVTGKSVLISGGAGAVGHYAIQFAKLLGATRILTTVSSDTKAALARAAGADTIINYRAEAVAERVQGERGGVDRVIEVDLANNIALAVAAVKPEGDVVVYGSGRPDIAVPFAPSIIKNIRYRFFMVYHLAAGDRQRTEAQLKNLLSMNLIQHNVAKHFPLKDIAAAHEAVESGQVMGNIVVDLS
jgi:NADPH:quinone reductase